MTEHNTEDRVVSSSINQGVPADLAAMTDEELLLEYRMTGGSAVFETLVKRYERELYNYLRRFLNNQVLAEDAFQATFMQVHLKCQLFDADRKVRPWLYTVATNQAIDIQRRNRRHRLVSLDRPNRVQHNELLVDLGLSATESEQPAHDGYNVVLEVDVHDESATAKDITNGKTSEPALARFRSPGDR